MGSCSSACRYFNSHGGKHLRGDCMVRPNRCIRVREGAMRGAILTVTDEVVSGKSECPHRGPYRGDAQFAPAPNGRAGE